MNAYLKTLLVIVFTCFFVWLLWFLVQDKNIPVLEPQGIIAHQERNLIYVAALLMLAVALPVFALTALIAWRYRASNRHARYLPNWEHNAAEEFIWWAVPCVIIIILASITWKSSHDLDPFQPLPGENEVIQVVSLNWKWLFIYPKEHIASVNQLVIPARQAIQFQVTADSPMNSFWIPQLGGQIYAMTGMITQVHLVANPGVYDGSSANISGRGFSGMNFKTIALPEDEFAEWVASTSASSLMLDDTLYAQLAKPSEKEPVRYYGNVQSGLFERIVGKYNAMSSHIQ